MNSRIYLFFLLTIFSSLLPMEVESAESFKQGKEVIVIEDDIKIEESQSFKISLIGDLLMDGSIRAQINKNGFNYPWEMVKEYFLNDDITVGNLETSITTRGTKWDDKQFNFRSDPRNLKAMKESGIDILTLANNHILDYGYDGLLDTLNHIDKSGIKRVGGGKDKKEAIQGIIVEEDGIKIGLLSFSRVIPNVKWYATDKSPGIVGAYDPHIEEVLNRIKEMKSQTDVVVLSIHWGVELSATPRKQEIDLAKKLVDAGADIIMGHHPHVLQGIEIYKGKPIFYSLGNFVFGTRNGLTSNTMIAQVNFINKKIDNIEMIPCTISGGRPTPLLGEERVKKINYMNTISKGFNTKFDKDGIIIINK